MRSVDVETEVVIHCARPEVASYAMDPDHATSWYRNIRQVEWKSEPPLAVGSWIAFVARFLGRELRYTYEVVELVPDQRFVMRTSDGPFPMETTSTRLDVADGTRMTSGTEESRPVSPASRHRRWPAPCAPPTARTSGSCSRSSKRTPRGADTAAPAG